MLHSENWDTRIAAARALEEVLNHVPLWSTTAEDRSHIKVETEIDPTAPLPEGVELSHALSFETFDIVRVLESGAPLLSSGGQVRYMIGKDYLLR